MIDPAIAPTAGIEHRRDGDRERIGWIVPDSGAFTAVDLLGRVVAESVDWVAAEEALESPGMSQLAEPWLLELPDGSLQRVRISQLTPERITLVDDDWGGAAVVGASMTVRELPFPAPAGLRPLHE